VSNLSVDHRGHQDVPEPIGIDAVKVVGGKVETKPSVEASNAFLQFRLAHTNHRSGGLFQTSISCHSDDLLSQALSENSVVGPRASVFSSDKDGEAGDVGSIVDAAG